MITCKSKTKLGCDGECCCECPILTSCDSVCSKAEENAEDTEFKCKNAREE